MQKRQCTPGKTLFVELDDRLRAAHVGHLRGHEVRLVALLPFNQEHELAGRVSCADDLLGLFSAIEAARFRARRCRSRAGAGRPGHRLGVARPLLRYALTRLRVISKWINSTLLLNTQFII